MTSVPTVWWLRAPASGCVHSERRPLAGARSYQPERLLSLPPAHARSYIDRPNVTRYGVATRVSEWIIRNPIQICSARERSPNSLHRPRLLEGQIVKLQLGILLEEIAQRPFVRKQRDGLIEFVRAEADSRRDDEPRGILEQRMRLEPL